MPQPVVAVPLIDGPMGLIALPHTSVTIGSVGAMASAGQLTVLLVLTVGSVNVLGVIV